MCRIRPVLCSILALALVCLGSCSRFQQGSPGPPPPTAAPVGPRASVTPTTAVDASGQMVRLVPDPSITPGDTLDVTVQDVCTPGYSKKVRNVPEEVKRRAYAQYGITHHDAGEFEVDHLISLELGGSNSIRNLWPESYTSQPWNAHVKDALENELHRQVCAGQLDLRTAQQDIATDWIAAYKKYFDTDAPLTRGRRRAGKEGSSREAGATPSRLAPRVDTVENGVQVWVNTRSGKYFHPGSRYYGQTKEGRYMTESEAEQRGYAAAKGTE